MSLLRCVVDVEILYGVVFEPVPEIDLGPVSGANVGPLPGQDVTCARAETCFKAVLSYK